jgi:hypothetical protein
MLLVPIAAPHQLLQQIVLLIGHAGVGDSGYRVRLGSHAKINEPTPKT